MNGPVTVLLAVLAVIPLVVLWLRFDAWLTERRYQEKQRGDESERFARARERLRHQINQDPRHTRLGHHHTRENTHD